MGRDALQPDGPGVPGGSVSDLPPPARRGSRPLSPLGFWVLTRYEDVVAVLRDQRFAKEPMIAAVAARFGIAPGTIGLSMLDRDPPDHTRLRGLVSKAFTPRVVERLRPHIQEIVDGLLARVDGPGGMDLIEEFAYPIPVDGHLRAAGRPRGGPRAASRTWSLDLARGLDAIMLPVDSEVALPQRHRPPGADRLLPRSHRQAPGLAARRSPVGPHRGRGGGRQAQRGRAAGLEHPAARGRPRDDGQPDRQRHPGPAAPSRPAPTPSGESRPHRQRDRGAAALRRPGAAHRADAERRRSRSAAGRSSRTRW